MKNNFQQKNKFFRGREVPARGFTLVETLVAISIFTVSVLTLMSVLASGIADTSYAKEKITASYLAQEGIEYMRNMRDTFTLFDSGGSQTGWNNFNTKVAGGTYLSNSLCAGANGCYFGDLSANDYTSHGQQMASLPLNDCGDSTCSAHPLLYDNATGKYGYASGAASGFTRQIKIVQASANETKILSTVYWRQSSGNYSLTFSETLFNWQ